MTQNNDDTNTVYDNHILLFNEPLKETTESDKDLKSPRRSLNKIDLVKQDNKLKSTKFSNKCKDNHLNLHS